MSAIPDRERGYSIERSTGTVHERYQDHAPRAMRTSARGVSNVLDGREPVLCSTCFPPKAKRDKPVASPSEQYANAWATKPVESESVTVVSESESE